MFRAFVLLAIRSSVAYRIGRPGAAGHPPSSGFSVPRVTTPLSCPAHA